MKFLSFTILALLACLAGAKHCLNQTIPVTITSRNAIYGNAPVPHNSIEVTAFAQAAAVQGVNGSAQAFTKFNNVQGTYNISTQFCTPDRYLSKDPMVVQVLTHGVGFDKTYWDLAYNNFNYSYVDAATDTYGYYTLSYDRLGVGNSSKGEPRDEIQAPLEVAALYELTAMLRNGTFPGINKPTSKTALTKVIHVGHSFGSIQTYTLASMYPDISDGIVLTGFSFNMSFLDQFAFGSNLVQANTNPRFQMLPDGYLVPSDTQAMQTVFLYPGYFDPDMLALADATKQPVTVGELLSLFNVPMENQYKGPVLVITGDNDAPFCGGNCSNTGDPSLASIPADVKRHFPEVSDDNFEAYVQPNTGHGINQHYNAKGAYRVINEFLNAKV